MTAFGMFHLDESYTGPTLQASAFLDASEWGQTRGEIVGMKSPLRLARPYYKGNPDPKEFAEKARLWHGRGCRVAVLNEPLVEVEDWQGGLPAFRKFWNEVRALTPGVKLYWPDPGGLLTDEAKAWFRPEVGGVDGFSLHVYGSLDEMKSKLDFCIARNPHLPIWIQECNFAAGRTVNRDQWAHDHLRPFLDYVRTKPQVEALTYFAWHWPHPEFDGTPVDARGTQIEQIIKQHGSGPLPVPSLPLPIPDPIDLESWLVKQSQLAAATGGATIQPGFAIFDYMARRGDLLEALEAHPNIWLPASPEETERFPGDGKRYTYQAFARLRPKHGRVEWRTAWAVTGNWAEIKELKWEDFS